VTQPAQAVAAALFSAPSRHRRRLRLAVALCLSLVLSAASVAATASPPQASVSVVVRAQPGADAAAVARFVTATLGGRVTANLAIFNGFAATLPAGAVSRVARLPGVAAVTPNGSVQLLNTTSTYPDMTSAGSLANIAWQIGAPRFWAYGHTGKGIDVAVIDSGVSPVAGLAQPGKVVHGADLSFERHTDNLRHLDTYGHGTHVASVIAGRDPEISRDDLLRNVDRFYGIAPGARIVSVKVANALGATDVSQVIAAIDWVVTNRQQDGLDIRVLNLSFGTDGDQDYLVDPLAHAVEQAWHAGIVVVVAGGNSGSDLGRLNNPAHDPFVIAVGASNTRGTLDIRDDNVTGFSSRGDGVRNPDVVAPGKQVVGLRVPGAHLDQLHPDARVGDRFFRGGGTSQAAAVVSGAAALIVAQRPLITPDQVKQLLRSTARSLPDAPAKAQGQGLINLWSAFDTRTASDFSQTWTRSDGSGSLDAARGSIRVVGSDGTVLSGETGVFDDGSPAEEWFDAHAGGYFFDGNSWSLTGLDGNSWSTAGQEEAAGSAAGTNGNSWSGSGWSGDAWTDGNSWSGNGWLGVSWGKRKTAPRQ
jgi:subtilisin family serine protease